VQGIFEVSPEFVEKQLESVLSDIAIESVKTGMLYTADIINVVVNTLTKFNVKKIVIDPVMVSTTGATLLTPGTFIRYVCCNTNMHQKPKMCC
jgi:hydroxymethylpyrimidine kinase/phosphomethylpyrimidine kinase